MKITTHDKYHFAAIASALMLGAALAMAGPVPPNGSSILSVTGTYNFISGTGIVVGVDGTNITVNAPMTNGAGLINLPQIPIATGTDNNGASITNLFVTYDRVELATNANVITYTTTDTNLISVDVTVVARATGVGNWLYCSLNDDKAANYRWYNTYGTETDVPARGYASTNSCGGAIGYCIGINTSTNANDFTQATIAFGEPQLGTGKYRKATYVSDYTTATGASMAGGFKWFSTAGVTNWTIWAPETSTNFLAGSSLIIRKVRRQ